MDACDIIPLEFPVPAYLTTLGSGEADIHSMVVVVAPATSDQVSDGEITIFLVAVASNNCISGIFGSNIISELSSLNA